MHAHPRIWRGTVSVGHTHQKVVARQSMTEANSDLVNRLSYCILFVDTGKTHWLSETNSNKGKIQRSSGRTENAEKYMGGYVYGRSKTCPYHQPWACFEVIAIKEMVDVDNPSMLRRHTKKPKETEDAFIARLSKDWGIIQSNMKIYFENVDKYMAEARKQQQIHLQQQKHPVDLTTDDSDLCSTSWYVVQTVIILPLLIFVCVMYIVQVVFRYQEVLEYMKRNILK